MLASLLKWHLWCRVYVDTRYVPTVILDQYRSEVDTSNLFEYLSVYKFYYTTC